MSHSLASGAAAAGAPLQTSSRLGLRGRIAGLAIGLILLGAVCGVVALSGLLTEKGKVASVSTTFRDFRTERSAYEGWLTSDDQMNMYAALGVLRDSKQHRLAAATSAQVVQGHAQAIASLNWLSAHADDPAIRRAAASTLADVR